MIRLMRIPTLLAAALLVLGGCSSDSTEPNGPLTGDWTYDVVDVRAPGDAESCSFTGVVIRLEQRGDRLSGSTGGGFGTCVRGAEQFPAVPLRPASVTGRVEGTRVELEVGDFLVNEGTLVDDEISGTADFGSGVEGSFTMSRR
jgi:hypothetical protein